MFQEIVFRAYIVIYKKALEKNTFILKDVWIKQFYIFQCQMHVLLGKYILKNAISMVGRL